MLTMSELKMIYPHYGRAVYKGVITVKGVHTLTSSNATWEVDIREAMRETGRKYKILSVIVEKYPNLGITTRRIKYEVY